MGVLATQDEAPVQKEVARPVQLDGGCLLYHIGTKATYSPKEFEPSFS
jgi:hypothetical protein